MPRLSEAKKDVVSCEKLGGSAHTNDPEMSEWGNPAYWRYVTQQWEQTRRTETSKYPEEKKSTEIPLVVASERGPALKLIWD